MPELPEVEITRRGIAPYLINRSVTSVIIRQPKLRWPIPTTLAAELKGNRIRAVERRAKYLLLDFGHGTLILHLGMSGSLRVVQVNDAPGPHDHFDLIVGTVAIRLRDPRRFGAVLWWAGTRDEHPLLVGLGEEPLSEGFTGKFLYQATRTRRQSIKQVLMNHLLVVGIGNIYANESLFRAGIRPRGAAQRLTRVRCDRLVEAIRGTLQDALAAGGSSVRDFMHSDGSSGYFQQQYFVYGREAQPCRVCGTPIRRIAQGQRASFYCSTCQR